MRLPLPAARWAVWLAGGADRSKEMEEACLQVMR